MLEFESDFFDQEVREGFYLDTTIKTLWAAELEVLSEIASICNKYGIKWYAAYGTLLGAIRHEGFVPWDDDMDIWVKRPDYNRLMKILPKELPEGYLVRSALTDEGYDQFHTCINSGHGISIAKEWLEKFHGCPFTVGLDIFPLDYLPRDEKERELQMDLFVLTGKVAQLAKNIGRGDYDKDDSDMTIEEAKEQIEEGVKYLEETWKYNINKQLLYDEKWTDFSSEMWKFGNYVASMYTEEESDTLVEYLDYARWNFKVFPKEWFEDGYFAEFEMFDIPIPKGYHELLSTIYGDYLRRVPKTGCHEYPYYARQLRQLREYVNDYESRAGKYGLIPIEDIELKDDFSIPDKWTDFVYTKLGQKKKIILSANDPLLYCDFPNEMLDSLEKMLDLIKQYKDEILLWWRPHRMMAELLGNIDKKYSDRYLKILNDYKEEKWGICDETDEAERAAFNCNLYYGEMNAVLQQVQNNNIPVILNYNCQLDEYSFNRDRERQYRNYIAYSDFYSDGNKRYISNNTYNLMLIQDIYTGKIEETFRFGDFSRKEQYIHSGIVVKNNKICFMPGKQGVVDIFDIDKKIMKSYKLDEQSGDDRTNIEAMWEIHETEDDIYFIPYRREHSLWKWNSTTNEVCLEEWWQINVESSYILGGQISNVEFFSIGLNENTLYITSLIDKKIKKIDLNDKVSKMIYDGENLWYQVACERMIVKYNLKTLKRKEYRFEKLHESLKGNMVYFRGMYSFDNYLLMFSLDVDRVYIFDKISENLLCIAELDNPFVDYMYYEKRPYVKLIKDKLLVMFPGISDKLSIDKNTFEVNIIKEEFELNDELLSYQRKVLLDNGALLYEEPGKYDLDFLIEYLTDEEK